jgi:hypothetical protein
MRFSPAIGRFSAVCRVESAHLFHKRAHIAQFGLGEQGVPRAKLQCEISLRAAEAKRIAHHLLHRTGKHGTSVKLDRLSQDHEAHLDPQIGTEIEEIDLRVVERMADELTTANVSPVADELFTARDRPAPLVVWSPSSDQLPLEELRFLLRFWQHARSGSSMPPVSAIDPLVLKPVLGNIIILDVLEDGADFRFRLFGTAVVEAARFDWTGRTVDDMRRTLKGPGPAFYLAGYRALLRRREPLLTVSPAMVIFKGRSWVRLILPHGDGDRVQRILVGNYAMGDGFVSDADERTLAELREQIRAERKPR